MPDREPLPPLDQWPTPIRWRGRNASSLTPEPIRNIAAAVYDARRSGVRPDQAYGWYAPGDDLTQPPRVRRTDHDDLVDAMAADRHTSSFLSTVLNPTSIPRTSEPPMPLPLIVGNTNLGFVLARQDVEALERFADYPAVENIMAVIDENRRLVAEVASMQRMVLAMEARLTRMKRFANPLVSTTPSIVTVFPEAVRPGTHAPSAPHPPGPAVPSVAGHPVANVRDAPVDVARSVPPGGASPTVGAARRGNDAGTQGATPAAAGAGDAGGNAATPSPSAAAPGSVDAVRGNVVNAVPSPAGVTVDQLRAEITAYTQRFGIERGRVLMLEHGRAATVSTVPDERRAFVIAAIRQASEMPTAATPAVG